MCGRHHAEETAALPTSASLSPLSPQPRCCAVHGPHAYVHTSRPQPCVFFTTPTSRRTAPQMATHDESPMTTQDVPHSSGHALAPLTCPAPSQLAAAIPHASHIPFVCPSPSHDLTYGLRPPSMRPDVFLRALPHPFLTRCHHPRHVPCALHVLPISCSSS